MNNSHFFPIMEKIEEEWFEEEKWQEALVLTPTLCVARERRNANRVPEYNTEPNTLCI